MMRRHYNTAASLRLAALLLGCCALLLHAADEPPPSTHLQITSDPPDANVYVDRELRGNTPIDLTDLSAGSHLVKVSKRDFVDQHHAVKLEAGVRRALDLRLQPLTGLILVTSTPDAAQLTIEGAVRGETPILISDLPIGRYRFKLSKPGYQDQEREVVVADRVPEKIDVVLTSDSASLTIQSVPPGAAVLINGVQRGTTPLTVTHVPEGETIVKVEAEGYAPFEQTLKLAAGASQTVDVPLKGLPGSLKVVSLPAGARVYINNQFSGETPFTLDAVNPGSYRIRAELPAYDPMARTVAIGLAENVVEEFRLTSNNGRLELTSAPAGVTVFVDGNLAGVTKAPAGETDRLSDPFTVERVTVGEHELRFTRKGYYDRVLPVIVERDKTLPVHGALKRRFVPDYEVHTRSRVYRGVLNSVAGGFVRLETAPGIVTPIPVADITLRRPIRKDDKEKPPSRP